MKFYYRFFGFPLDISNKQNRIEPSSEDPLFILGTKFLRRTGRLESDLK